MALLVSSALSLSGQENLPAGAIDGPTLAAELCAMQPLENLNWHGSLKISARNRKTVSVPVICQWTAGSSNWSVTYLTGATNNLAAERLTIVFSTNTPPQYIYAQAPSPDAPLAAPISLTGTAADIPLAGSDFWLSDLGFAFYHWPGQKLLDPEHRHSRPCYVLESTNPAAPAGSYASVKMWVEKAHLAPLEAEAYGTDGKLLKAYELGSLEKVGDTYLPKDLKISNRQTGSRTQLVFDLPAK